MINMTEHPDYKKAQRLIKEAKEAGETVLNLSWLDIDTLPPEISGLTNLEWLNLYDTQITDIEPLRALTNLTWLWINGSHITYIEPLRDLTNLTTLWLNCSHITEESKEVLKAMKKDNPNLKIIGVEL